MRLRLAVLACLSAVPAHADVAEAVGQVIVPATAALSARADELATAARGCDPAAMRPAFAAASEGWMRVQHLNLGPLAEAGRAQAMNYWPDPKDKGAAAQAALIAAADPAALAALPAPARGLAALERLIWADPPPAGYACDLLAATAADFAANAHAVAAGWREGLAPALIHPGAPGPYLTEAEAKTALLTQISLGLDGLGDDRLGRPLGSFHRPRPDRAEAILSGRSLANIRAALAALRAEAAALVPEAPLTMAAFDRAEKLAGDLNDPVFAGVADPSGRLKVEILQQAIHATRDAAMSEMSASLGVTLGFNAADGD